jgi:hypothetical protein
MCQTMVFGAKVVAKKIHKISAEMLVKQNSIFCAINIRLVPLRIVQIGCWKTTYMFVIEGNILLSNQNFNKPDLTF